MTQISIIIIGIVLSIIFYEITELSPGGIIVPSVLVAYIQTPERIIYTLIVSVLTYLIVKALSKVMLIFGKRRFVLMILVSLVINYILLKILGVLSFESFLSVSLIGYTISGIISNEYAKQGIPKTLLGLVIVTSLLEIIVLIGQNI